MMSEERNDRIVVAILNWNGRHHLATYLPSVVLHSQGFADVIVIDNGSSDDSVDWLSMNFPSVEIIRLTENKGFSAGYNEVLNQIDADYYILLNSDVRVSPNWIDPVIQMMKEQQFIACQPLIRNDSDPELFEYAGAAGGYIDRDGFTFCAGRMFEVFESDEGQYNANREVFWASGAALFIKSSAYHEVGGLDTAFFAHMEEIDLCWRLKNRGYRIGCCGDSVVFHLGGGTLQKLNPFKTYLNFRNNLFLLVKNHHRKWLYPMLFRRMILDGIAAIKFFFEGYPDMFFAVWKAHLHFWGNFSLMTKKRKEEYAKCQHAAETAIAHPINYAGWYNESIIIDYFFKKKQTFDALNPDCFCKSRILNADNQP